MKVREAFQRPDFSPFTRAAMEAGEALEKQGWSLVSNYYSQGEQGFCFEKGGHVASLQITEKEASR